MSYVSQSMVKALLSLYHLLPKALFYAPWWGCEHDTLRLLQKLNPGVNLMTILKMVIIIIGDVFIKVIIINPSAMTSSWLLFYNLTFIAKWWIEVKMLASVINCFLFLFLFLFFFVSHLQCVEHAFISKWIDPRVMLNMLDVSINNIFSGNS